MQEILDEKIYLTRAFDGLTSALETVNAAPNLSIDQLNAAKTVLFSVDMNNGFAKSGALYSSRIEATLSETARLIRCCNQNGIRVIGISDRHSAESLELTSYPPHCMEGTEEWKLAEELEIPPESILYKNSTNGMFAGADKIVAEGYSCFLITGCCTDICIYQLALSIKAWLNEHNRSARVIVPINLVETYDAPWHNADLMNAVFLHSMTQNGVEIVSLKF